MNAGPTSRASRSSLTGRERVGRALRGEAHDRVPRYDSFWPETIERWGREGLDDAGEDAVRELLGSDFARLSWTWPRPFPGRRDVIAEDQQTQTVIDAQGNTVRLHKRHSSTPEHVAFGCTTVEQWRAEYRPRLQRGPQPGDEAPLKANARRAEDNGRWLHLAGIGPVTGVHQLVGDEVAMISAIDDPAWVIDMATIYTDAILAGFQRNLELSGAAAHGIWIFDDMGYNRGPFFSPDVYRQIYLPQHRRMTEWAKARGMDTILHTDGDVRLLMDDIAEAGFDCMQPLEAKAGMDVRELAEPYADRLSFFGNIDAVVLSTNNRERIEHEVTTKLAAGMAQRRYIYHSDHTVPPDVSWSTYQFVIELLDRHGHYAR